MHSAEVQLTFAGIGSGLMDQKHLEDDGGSEHDEIVNHFENPVPKEGSAVLAYKGATDPALRGVVICRFRQDLLIAAVDWLGQVKSRCFPEVSLLEVFLASKGDQRVCV